VSFRARCVVGMVKAPITKIHQCSRQCMVWGDVHQDVGRGCRKGAEHGKSFRVRHESVSRNGENTPLAGGFRARHAFSVVKYN
jgi:hypothetical protein